MKGEDAGAPSLERARELLHRYWGYPDFRPGQETAIKATLAGRDTLTVMPTGGGKSLCYQVPALLLPGLTLVVSPLISLMKDQTDALERAGVPATLINSTLGLGEQQARLDAAERGEFKLLYVAPERFEAEGFAARLARLRVSLLAVDEAHCVSEWGHDFRPSYLRLARVREMVGGPPVAALTATATPEVRRDIVRQLDLRDPATLVAGFDRRNLALHVLRAKNDSEKDRLLLRLLRDKDGAAIVYAATRKNVDALTALLNGTGIGAVGYHAGLGDGDRKRVQDAFMSGETPVVVATNAFGMGIDKPDVRLVVHYNMPGNLEAYYQEAGRAGRDGEPSECVLLHSYADRFTHEFFIEQAHPSREAVQATMRALRRAADAEGALTVPLPEFARAVPGVKGDRQVYSALRILADHALVRQSGAGAPTTARVRLIATPQRITRELDRGARPEELAFLRGLWRGAGGEALAQGAELEWGALAAAAGGRRSAERLLGTLQDEGFLEWQTWSGEGVWVLDRTTPLPQLPVDWRGAAARKAGETRKLQQIQRYAYHEQCRRGYLLRYFGDPAAMEECGACDVCLGLEQPAPSAARGGGRRDRSPRPAAEPGAADPQTFEALRTVRTRLARDAGLPAYLVASDAVLRGLAARRPRTAEEMLEVPGVGPKTLDRYGHALLEAIGGTAASGDGASPAAPFVAPTLPPAPPMGPAEEVLFERLRGLRGELAREAGLPGYCIFPDRTLREMARRRPAGDAEFLEIPGVGEAKLERYIPAFRSAIEEQAG